MIAVAVSGGVDSMMAARLLQQHTPDLIAVHFLTGFEPAFAGDRHPVQAVGDQLGIPVHVVDLSAEFRASVVDYFTAEYRSGRTPNPCVVCNPSIKFGALLGAAERLGAAGLATGHYAVVRRGADGRQRLCKGVDPVKDQSYFLARLSQSQLDKAHFPLGALTKDHVRALAAQMGLTPAVPAESQDVCFIRTGTYVRLVQPEAGPPVAPGEIETVDGRVIGRHSGLARYTVGQRRGINCPAAEPYYVLRLDPDRNRLIVGAKSDLLASACTVEDLRWILDAPTDPLRVQARVRYRSAVAPCTLIPTGPTSVCVEFDRPQSAITPGQAAVFYDGDVVLGGGFIARQP